MRRFLPAWRAARAGGRRRRQSPPTRPRCSGRPVGEACRSPCAEGRPPWRTPWVVCTGPGGPRPLRPRRQRPRRTDDRRAHPLAPLVIGAGKDRHLAHPGHLTQDGLDLGRIDVDPAGDDQVVPTSRKVQVALGIEVADVPDIEGAVNYWFRAPRWLRRLSFSTCQRRGGLAGRVATIPQARSGARALSPPPAEPVQRLPRNARVRFVPLGRYETLRRHRPMASLELAGTFLG